MIDVSGPARHTAGVAPVRPDERFARALALAELIEEATGPTGPIPDDEIEDQGLPA